MAQTVRDLDLTCGNVRLSEFKMPKCFLIYLYKHQIIAFQKYTVVKVFMNQMNK